MAIERLTCSWFTCLVPRITEYRQTPDLHNAVNSDYANSMTRSAYKGCSHPHRIWYYFRFIQFLQVEYYHRATIIRRNRAGYSFSLLSQQNFRPCFSIKMSGKKQWWNPVDHMSLYDSSDNFFSKILFLKMFYSKMKQMQRLKQWNLKLE